MINAMGNAIIWLASSKLKPPTPPLLRGQLSEIDTRLTAQFPVGSSASDLAAFLLSQGFGPVELLGIDPLVVGSVFRQTGGGLKIYPMTAVVKWDEDGDGRIISMEVSRGFSGF